RKPRHHRDPRRGLRTAVPIDRRAIGGIEASRSLPDGSRRRPAPRRGAPRMPPATPRPLSPLAALGLLAPPPSRPGGVRRGGGGGLRGWVGEVIGLGAELSESVAAIVHPEADWSPWGWAIYQGYGLLATALLPFCCAWTLALLALRPGGPRPRLRRLARQPGTI